MSETQMLEALGRKQMQLESLQAQAGNLLNVLADVVSGKTARSRVLVNLTVGSWEIAEQGQRPGMPATINGLPHCVVAPDELAQATLDCLAHQQAEAAKCAANGSEPKEPGEIEVTLPPN